MIDYSGVAAHLLYLTLRTTDDESLLVIRKAIFEVQEANAGVQKLLKAYGDALETNKALLKRN